MPLGNNLHNNRLAETARMKKKNGILDRVKFGCQVRNFILLSE